MTSGVLLWHCSEPHFFLIASASAFILIPMEGRVEWYLSTDLCLWVVSDTR